MSVRIPAVICAALALGTTAAAAAAPTQPSRYQLVTTVAPGDRAAITVGTLPQGEFSFALKASSDGAKTFTLTQQRNGGKRFTVLKAPGPIANGACQGAAGSLVCTGMTTPAAPKGKRWTFALTNSSDRPLSVTLTVRWRPVGNAG